MRHFAHHIGDYAAATAHLSFVEDAAYHRLLRLYYRDERALPSDVAACQRLVAARSREERAARIRLCAAHPPAHQWLADPCAGSALNHPAASRSATRARLPHLAPDPASCSTSIMDIGPIRPITGHRIAQPILQRAIPCAVRFDPMAGALQPE